MAGMAILAAVFDKTFGADQVQTFGGKALSDYAANGQPDKQAITYIQVIQKSFDIRY